jgi:hypothetical protein
MRASSSIILGFLGGYRRRALRQELWAGLIVAVSVALAASLLAFLGMLLLDEMGVLRTILLVFLAGGFGLVMTFFVIRPRLRLRGGSVGLARVVEQRLGESSLDVVSALQLGQQRSGLFSAELVSAHLRTVAQRLAALDPMRLLARGRLRRPIGILLVLGVLCTGAWVVSPQTYLSGLQGLLSASESASVTGSESVQNWVGDIQLRYRFPDYTGRSEKVVEGTDGAILALPGTQVDLIARADRPIASGRLRLGDEALPLKVAASRGLSTQLVIMEPGSYRFDLVDGAGQTWRSPRGHPVHLETDRAPEVRLSKPGRDLVVQEQDRVDLLFDVRDDFGLEEIRLVWRIVGRDQAQEKKVLKRLSGQGQRAARRSFGWELAELGLAPGEQVQFFIEAADNDTVRGPKTGRSATVTLKVFSADEHHRELMDKVQALWEELLGRLGDHLEQEPAVRDPADVGLKDHASLHKRLVEFVRQVDKIGADLRQDRLAWGPLVDALANIARGVRSQNDQLAWMLRSAAAKADAPLEMDLRMLASQRLRRIDNLERDTLYLEDLLDRERLEDLERIAADLDAAQGRLTELMERFRRAPDAQTRKQIEAEIARIKQQIAELLKRQAQVLKAVRDEYLNPDALRKMMSERDVMGAIDRIQKMMMEGRVDEAMAELKRLREQIDGLKQAIERSKQDFGSERYRELAKAMARIQGELNQIAEQQGRLLERTGQLREKVVERLKKRVAAKGKKDLVKLAKRLESVIEDLEKIDPVRLDPFPGRERNAALRHARGLDKLLKAADLALSLEVSGKLAGSTERLKSYVDPGPDPGAAPSVRARHRSAKSAATESAAIHEALRKLLPDGRKMLGAGESDQVRKIEGRQQELSQRLSKLRAQMRGLNQKAPLFGPPMLGGMDRSGRSMRQAGSDLGKLDPRSAWPHQKDAMAELENLKKSMDQACQKSGKGGGMPLPMGRGRGHGQGIDSGGMGGDLSREPVEIPTEDDYQAPEAFRRELLDGMKDPVPEDYQPQVRRYYEELVR